MLSHSLTHSRTHSLTHSLTHALTHSLTHPPTHSHQAHELLDVLGNNVVMVFLDRHRVRYPPLAPPSTLLPPLARILLFKQL